MLYILVSQPLPCAIALLMHSLPANCYIGMSLLHATNLLQIGDEGEVMYLIAKTSKERDEWMEAIRSGTS